MSGKAVHFGTTVHGGRWVVYREKNQGCQFMEILLVYRKLYNCKMQFLKYFTVDEGMQGLPCCTPWAKVSIPIIEWMAWYPKQSGWHGVL